MFDNVFINIWFAAVDRAELLAMQKKFRELASREGNPNTMTRREFKDGLDVIGIVESGVAGPCAKR